MGLDEWNHSWKECEIMLRIRQIKLPINHNENDLKIKIAKKLKINEKEISNYQINKQSIDARDKNNIMYVYEIDIQIKNEKQILKKHMNDILEIKNETYKLPKPGSIPLNNQIIIVGAGPAGLFAGYMLAKAGYKPLIIERGEDINNRIKTVENFWKTKKLNPNSNVQFGAGGAGTFSDGKLNTNSKDKTFRGKEVLKTFVKHGAPKDILYINNPHIGTDLLRNIIQNIIDEIIKNGKIKYNTCLTNIITKEGKLTHIEINKKEIIPCENLILALGHSSRDTFEILLKQNLNIKPKPFAVGIRIQHSQSLINKAQYGENLNLPPASYKLTYQTTKKRGVYSFCMCPGGYVVNASSEQNMLAINGMSNHARDSENANSAIVVTISPKDYGNNPLDGIKFQRKLEKKAYEIGNGKIPVQLFKDFIQNKPSKNFGQTKPIFKGDYQLTNIRNIFPQYISKALTEGIKEFDKKIKGFASDDAILSAVESRTSSPIKIERDEHFTSNIKGIYPCGEGAGYAGGIMTSAIDGIKVAEEIIKTYKPK